jgi:cytoskeleton protein RodZ
MPEIGATLREARMRERIDVSEIEAQTKIRAKYLRALENEEWDLLPGPTFVKSFLRTYAQALGLDGRALVEEYKLAYESPGEGAEPERRAPQPVQSGQAAGATPPRRTRPRAGAIPRPGPSRAYMAAVTGAVVVIALLLYALLSGGSSKGPTQPTARTRDGVAKSHHAPRRAAAVPPAGLASVRFEPTGEVYVCLIGDGRRRIPGEILTPTTPTLTYHARRFELTLGNNALTLIVNGAPHPVPASATAIGYAITRAGVTPLAAAEEPTCK